MRKIYEDDELRKKFFELVENTDRELSCNNRLYNFIMWTYDNKFFDNIDDRDICDCLEENNLWLPLFKRNGVCIGLDYWNGQRYKYITIGIDPAKCFNKTKQCSITCDLMRLSKREEERFYRLLNRLMDKKDNLRKEWIKEAPTCWYGSFEKFGE